jgi:hypothetical protein
VKRIVTLLLLVAFANGTTVRPMSVEKLTERSSDVVLARAEDSWAEWNPKRTMLHTVTRFRVAKAIKGQGAQTFLVRQMGGRADGIVQKVSGVRSWRQGDEAVLFLRPSKEQPGTYVVTGLMQGDFRVQRESGEARVSNGVPEVEVVGAASKAGEFRGQQLTLRELERRVRAVAQKGAHTE